MERRFSDITLSIFDLTRQGLARKLNVINDDIIKAIEDLYRLETPNGNSQLVEAYRVNISGLEKERIHASLIRYDMSSNFDTDSSVNKNSSVGIYTEDRGVDSAMSFITDDNLHREVRRRRSAAIRARRRPI